MYDLFMTYWTIGVCFVVVYQITSFLYMKSQGDKYIYNDNPVPIVIIIFMNLLLTIFYPFFIVLLIVDTLHHAQQRKRMSHTIQELSKKFSELEQKQKEEHHE